MNELYNFVIRVINGATSILPDCPFERFLHAANSMEFLGVLNWFLPIREAVAVGEAWLVSIVVFYGVQALLRWVKVVGS